MKRKQFVSIVLASVVAASLAMTGCGSSSINANAVGATYGDKDISLGYLNFVARYTQSTYDSFFASYYGEDYWTNPQLVDEDGRTMEETVKETIIEEIENQYVLADHLADYGVEITEDEMAQIKEVAANFMEKNSKKALQEMGAKQEYVEDMLYYQTVEHKMTEAIEAEIDTEVSDEECARGKFSLVELSMVATDESGFVTEVLSTEEELGSLEADAQAIMAAAQQAADEETDPLQAAAQAYGYSMTGSRFNPYEDPADNMDYDPAVLTELGQMEEGDYSVVKGGSAYYVLRLDATFDETATAAAKNEILNERGSEHFTEVTDGYKEGVSFTLDEKQWEKVTFDNIFTQPEPEEEDLSVTAE